MIKRENSKWEKANAISIVEYVQKLGYTINSKKNGNELTLVEHDSLKINPVKNVFTWYSRDLSGGVIQLCQELEGIVDKFDAVKRLLNEEFHYSKNYQVNKKNYTKEERKTLKLPKFDYDMKNVYAYLIKERLIDKEIVFDYANKNLIKQTENIKNDKIYKNVAFLSYDESKKIKYISLRGVNSFTKFRGEVSGSDKSYGFKYLGNNEVVNVFESPIDMMSYQTTSKMFNLDWKNDNCISLGGISDKALIKFLDNNKNIKSINLCLDVDDAGVNASEKIKENINNLYPNKYNINVSTPLYGKDFNEFLIINNKLEEYINNGIEIDVLKEIVNNKKSTLNISNIFLKENLTNINNNKSVFIYENIEDFLSICSIAVMCKKDWKQRNFIISKDVDYIKNTLKQFENIKDVVMCFSKNNSNYNNKIDTLKECINEINIGTHISKDETYLKDLNNYRNGEIKKNKICNYR